MSFWDDLVDPFQSIWNYTWDTLGLNKVVRESFRIIGLTGETVYQVDISNNQLIQDKDIPNSYNRTAVIESIRREIPLTDLLKTYSVVGPSKSAEAYTKACIRYGLSNPKLYYEGIKPELSNIQSTLETLESGSVVISKVVVTKPGDATNEYTDNYSWIKLPISEIAPLVYSYTDKDSVVELTAPVIHSSDSYNPSGYTVHDYWWFKEDLVNNYGSIYKPKLYRYLRVISNTSHSFSCAPLSPGIQLVTQLTITVTETRSSKDLLGITEETISTIVTGSVSASTLSDTDPCPTNYLDPEEDSGYDIEYYELDLDIIKPSALYYTVRYTVEGIDKTFNYKLDSGDISSLEGITKAKLANMSLVSVIPIKDITDKTNTSKALKKIGINLENILDAIKDNDENVRDIYFSLAVKLSSIPSTNKYILLFLYALYEAQEVNKALWESYRTLNNSEETLYGDDDGLPSNSIVFTDGKYNNSLNWNYIDILEENYSGKEGTTSYEITNDLTLSYTFITYKILNLYYQTSNSTRVKVVVHGFSSAYVVVNGVEGGIKTCIPGEDSFLFPIVLDLLRLMKKSEADDVIYRAARINYFAVQTTDLEFYQTEEFTFIVSGILQIAGFIATLATLGSDAGVIDWLVLLLVDALLVYTLKELLIRVNDPNLRILLVIAYVAASLYFNRKSLDKDLVTFKNVAAAVNATSAGYSEYAKVEVSELKDSFEQLKTGIDEEMKKLEEEDKNLHSSKKLIGEYPDDFYKRTTQQGMDTINQYFTMYNEYFNNLVKVENLPIVKYS